MTDYVRRLVSGNKARFKDKKLDVELDLVYLTDQVIIMGYPASGMEGLYRNPKEDVKKFLEHRHGKNYWIFNFCPLRENSYDATYFDNRVSRYPFPDHHSPPLAIMPLVAREMRAWLDGSKDRVAVLHCKAGKGRSGTMACTYLLTLQKEPTAPELERSYTAKQWAKLRVDDTMDVVPEDIDSDTGGVSESRLATPSDVKDWSSSEGSTPTPNSDKSPEPGEPPKSFSDSLKGVLDLHTARRMKPADGKKVKQGVSIPSQRRWLYYWALLLSNEAPKHMWPPLGAPEAAPPRVRLTEVRIRMNEETGVKLTVARAANALLDRAGVGSAARNGSRGQVWASLARYDDDFVKKLEDWERHTRGNSLGERRGGSAHMGEEELQALFADGRWDQGKMVRSFARLGVMGEDGIAKAGDEKERTTTYALRPLTDASWGQVLEGLKEGGDASDSAAATATHADVPGSEANSMLDVTAGARERGVVVDAGREVRVKLYMGQIFMGWSWFVPTFHMPQPPPGVGSPKDITPSRTTMHLTRKELDFPIGIGEHVLDVEIDMEWLRPEDAEAVQPPAREDSQEAVEAGEPAGLAAQMPAVVAGRTVKDVVEAKEASDD
ncbi:hypothetical protein BD626DRAFT_424809 [Schizophyllum amplum]|uniref:phosphatidylinositol-3,4,5-trisphosphate 3-phosphatase n=1 Tax=Schizophyllum amplum TaxID=97359 RepID=A0A550CTM7_9AGAR|nr:hypothetical protein BD626DRAFT_424809 [Auriculariopsis ampla]